MREELEPEKGQSMEGGVSEPDSGLAEWKRRALANFSRWLDELEEIPDEEQSDEADLAPDLFSFYEELSALRNEVRKANRRAAETFSQWGESLERYGESLASVEEAVAANAPEEPGVSREICLGLVELHDRLTRAKSALDRPPPARRFPGSTARWEKEWESVRQGISIVRDHAENLLLKADVRPIRAHRQAFDPGSMVAVAVAVEANGDFPPNTVVEVLVAGYERAGEVLRPAEVKVTPREGAEGIL